jgi:hypothetical protein
MSVSEQGHALAEAAGRRIASVERVVHKLFEHDKRPLLGSVPSLLGEL